MSRWIEIDDQVLGELQAKAEAWVDSPNRVLRRLLGLPPVDPEPTAAAPGPSPLSGTARAPWGALLSPERFELPILKALVSHGGAARRHSVLRAVEAELGDALSDVDRGRVQSGMVRWEIRTSEVRQSFLDRGWMKTDSPRGLWELTEAGFEAAAELEAQEAGKRESEAPG